MIRKIEKKHYVMECYCDKCKKKLVHMRRKEQPDRDQLYQQIYDDPSLGRIITIYDLFPTSYDGEGVCDSILNHNINRDEVIILCNECWEEYVDIIHKYFPMTDPDPLEVGFSYRRNP